MDILIDLLFILHLAGLTIGIGAGIAMVRLSPVIGMAGEDGKAALYDFGRRLGGNGHWGLAILWVTGPLLVWLKYGGLGGLGPWFWAKMVLVVVLSASVGVATASFRRAQTGQHAALQRARLAAWVNLVVGIAVIFCAVFAFH